MDKLLYFTVNGLIFACLLFIDLRAENLQDILKKHPNEVFVESGGTAVGQATSWAWSAGFKRIYLIDSNPVLVEHAKYLFSTYYDLYPCYRPIPNSNWKPELGFFVADSAKDLGNLIKDINSTITFYLHNFSPSPDELDQPNNILLELMQIQQHPMNTHTIIIDNIDFVGTPQFGNISLDTIVSLLKMINKDYEIIFSNGGHLGKRPNALLIASP